MRYLILVMVLGTISFNQVFIILIMICLSMLYIVRLTASTPVFFAASAGLFVTSLPNSFAVESGLSSLLTIAVPT